MPSSDFVAFGVCGFKHRGCFVEDVDVSRFARVPWEELRASHVVIAVSDEEAFVGVVGILLTAAYFNYLRFLCV